MNIAYYRDNYQLFRQPADWNCFFDGCYSDYLNFVDTVYNTQNNVLKNACTIFGFTFTNDNFDTNLNNIVQCILLFIQNDQV